MSLPELSILIVILLPFLGLALYLILEKVAPKSKSPNPRYSLEFWRKWRKEIPDDGIVYPGSPPA